MPDLTGLNLLNKATDRYSAALEELRQTEPDDPRLRSRALELLFARDALEETLCSGAYQDVRDSGKLLSIDDRITAMDDWLRDNPETIAPHLALGSWRKRLDPPAEAWWWHLEAPEKRSLIESYEWVWNALTVVALGLTASYIVGIFKAFSVGNLTVSATFAGLVQIGGLAAVTQGTLTERGQQKTREILASLNVPARFQSAAMLLTALLLLGTVHSLHSSMTRYYLDTGNAYYERGDLMNAELAFLRGTQVNPEQLKINEHLGQIYESIGLQDEAIQKYYLNVKAGDTEGINDLGRTLINRVNPVTRKTDPALAESFLLVGMQRIDSEANPDKNIEYQLNRNLGWALLEQKKYDEAEKYLKRAILVDMQIPEKQVGGGMAYCFLSKVYKEKSKEGSEAASESFRRLAEENCDKCVQFARPETIDEYRWFIKADMDQLAYFIDTHKIVYRGSEDGTPQGADALRHDNYERYLKWKKGTE